MLVLLLLFRQVKSALWKAPLRSRSFCLIFFHLNAEFYVEPFFAEGEPRGGVRLHVTVKEIGREVFLCLCGDVCPGRTSGIPSQRLPFGGRRQASMSFCKAR